MKSRLSMMLLFVLIQLWGCSNFNVYYSKEVKKWESIPAPDSSGIDYTVYLLGDAGDPNLNTQEPTLRLLQSFIEKDSTSALIFLGDNIYFDGMPAPNAAHRPTAEKKINEQIDILKNYKGEVYFIAGNHDWDYMKQDGLKKIKLEEEYVEASLNRGNTFVPDGGCPGPFYVRLYSSVIFLAIDSQWWLHKYEKPYGRCGECDAEDEEDFLIQLEDFIRNNRNRHIVIAAHHPLFSNGNHGGYYNILDHIFPLRIIRSKWYLPLPVIGSLYPLYRKFGGVDQDIPHYRYQKFKNDILSIINKYDNVVYAAGHDHNLQYHRVDSLDHIISGSGSKINPLKGGGDALYTHRHKGFALLNYYSNGEAWVEFWIPEGNGEKGKLDFRSLLYTRTSGHAESYCSLSAIDYSDSTIIKKAGESYNVSKFKKFWLGDHYRREWFTPIKVPLLDLKTKKDGLIPYGKGGGKQSITLKLKNIDDKEYVLRSINKDPKKIVPVDFRNTLLHDIVQDQISAQHPYGSLAVAKIADAVNVFHTNPEIVLIPNDSCLGPYREEFKNMLAIFEESPDENHEDVASLGNSKDIVGTDKMRNDIETDNDNKIDERGFARARLLDMLIGDWDRHERQYRWAAVKTKKGILYKPVPEDRDQVFFKFDGVIPHFVNTKWGLRNLQDFNYDFDDIKGLNMSARILDRRYLSSLNRSDWIAIGDSMKTALTDTVIENSIHCLPEPIFNISGEEIISKLKSRRDKLPKAAEEYYKILAKYVDVFGSDKHEKFKVERLNNNETKIEVYKINKEGEIKEKIYERIFYTKETKEIRLYGLAGNDVFTVEGKVKKGIKIRIIGGDEGDSITDHSRVRGAGKETIVYDTREETTLNVNAETNKKLSKNETINYPNQDNFFYNSLAPGITLNYNPDDGAFIGGGFLYKKYKFRTNPYGAQHRFLISKATNTGSTKIDYKGDIKNALSSFNLGINFEMYTPAFVMNFFGYGNESVRQDTAAEFYRVRLEQITFNPSLNKELTKYFIIGMGPNFQYFKLENNPNNFLHEKPDTSQVYSGRSYAGLRAFFRLGTRDNDRNPTRGILLSGEANYNKRLGNNEFYSQYISNFSFYITPNLPFQLTFAGRIGGAMNFGDFEFYQANTLGSTTGLGYGGGNLRGYRKTRFIGDKSFYQNAEVRCQLFKFNAYIFPGKFGILGLFDNGRVWAKNENSKKWHMGYGGGVWIDLFSRLIMTTTYSLSEEDRVVNFTLGFFF